MLPFQLGFVKNRLPLDSSDPDGPLLSCTGLTVYGGKSDPAVVWYSNLPLLLLDREADSDIPVLWFFLQLLPITLWRPRWKLTKCTIIPNTDILFPRLRFKFTRLKRNNEKTIYIKSDSGDMRKTRLYPTNIQKIDMIKCQRLC